MVLKLTNKITIHLTIGQQTNNKQITNNQQQHKKEKKEKKDKNNKKENKKKKVMEIVELYNSTTPLLPHVQKVTPKRERAIDTFLKEFTLDEFKRICEIANSSDFLTGNNNRGWKADFDFIMRIDKATAILEGKYGNKTRNSNSNDLKELEEEICE